jgi:putative glycosyltransferase (TIGR04372 family)
MWSSKAIYIVKRCWSETESRYLTWPEVMTPPVALMYDSRLLAKRGLRAVDNTAEEIRELCIEMLDRLDGRTYTPGDDAEQHRWHALKRGYWTERWRARAGRGFLARHWELMGG